MKISEIVRLIGMLTFWSTCVTTSLSQTVKNFAPISKEQFMAGVDASEIDTLLQHGAVYRVNGLPEDPYVIFQRNGINWMRLRLFVNPNGAGPLCTNLPYALHMAKRIKRKGFHLLLDLHYSDGWADPAQQKTPAAWTGLSHRRLAHKVSVYTKQTLKQFEAVNATPDMVEVGNEITNGMLWPDGKVSPQSTDPNRWRHLTDLLRAGTDAVRTSSKAGSTPQVMIHIDRGGDAEASTLFYDHLVAADIRFDVIGLSDYPWWQGSMSQLKMNMDQLAARYGKPVVVVETSFPFVNQTIEVKGRRYEGKDAVDKVLHFAPTPAGQAEYLQRLIETIQATRSGLGSGVFYWAAGWIKAEGWGAPSWSKDWEGRALFDADGNTLPAVKILGGATMHTSGIVR